MADKKTKLNLKKYDVLLTNTVYTSSISLRQ